jgi:hypothetical protein
MCPVVRAGALEAGQNRVVDVDRPAPEPLAQVIREDLDNTDVRTRLRDIRSRDAKNAVLVVTEGISRWTPTPRICAS